MTSSPAGGRPPHTSCVAHATSTIATTQPAAMGFTRDHHGALAACRGRRRTGAAAVTCASSHAPEDRRGRALDWCPHGSLPEHPARRRGPQAQVARVDRPRASARSSPRCSAAPTTSSARSPPSCRERLDQRRRRRQARRSILDDLLPEAFAAVREAGTRTLGQRHFDVQIMGGAALHFGWVAEMKTGEGKTLVATLPVVPQRARRRAASTSSPSTTTWPSATPSGWAGSTASSASRSASCSPQIDDCDAEARGLRRRHHLRHQQRVRLRLPPRQHGRRARGPGAARPLLRHRRRGRLDPHRRGPHAAHHLRAAPTTRRSSTYQFAAHREGPQARPRLRGRRGEAHRRADRGGHRPRSRRRSASTTSTSTSTRTSCTSSRPRCAPRSCSSATSTTSCRTAR